MAYPFQNSVPAQVIPTYNYTTDYLNENTYGRHDVLSPIFDHDKAVRRAARAAFHSQGFQDPQVMADINASMTQYFRPDTNSWETRPIPSYKPLTHRWVCQKIMQAGLYGLPFVRTDSPGSIIHRFQNLTLFPDYARNTTGVGYIGIMPFVVPQEGNTYKALSDQIRLWYTEGFGTNADDSILEAVNRLRLVIALNYEESPDSSLNKIKKAKMKVLFEQTTSAVSLFAFSWMSEWVLRDESTAKIESHYIKRFFKAYKLFYPEQASTNLANAMSGRPVPMQRIRDEIFNSRLLENQVLAVRGGLPRPVRLIIMDGDTKQVRNDGLGLLTHFDDLYAQNPRAVIVTTGYRMYDPDNNYVWISTGADLVGRQILGEAAYLAETGICIALDTYGIGITCRGRKLSCTRSEGNNLESVGLIENLVLNRRTDYVSQLIIFGKKGALITATPPRVSVPISGNQNPAIYRSANNLKTWRALSQTSLNVVFNFVPSLLRMLPGCGGQHNNGIVKKIFDAFDPIAYAEHSQDFLDHYLHISELISYICTVRVTNKNFIPDWSQVLPAPFQQYNADQYRLISFITDNVNIVDHALYDLRNQYKAGRLRENRFSEDEINYIYHKTKNFNHAIYLYIVSVINNTPYVAPEFPPL